MLRILALIAFWYMTVAMVWFVVEVNGLRRHSIAGLRDQKGWLHPSDAFDSIVLGLIWPYRIPETIWLKWHGLVPWYYSRLFGKFEFEEDGSVTPHRGTVIKLVGIKFGKRVKYVQRSTGSARDPKVHKGRI